MTGDDIELIQSPLSQTMSEGEFTLRIDIYAMAGEPWIVDVQDAFGTSTVWDDGFTDDQDALDVALAAIKEDGGVLGFSIRARQEANAAERVVPVPRPHDLQKPLSDEEVHELDDILLYDMDAAPDAMTLDILDGFLHAIAMGPETVLPSRWLPKVWGEAEEGHQAGALPPMLGMEQANHVLGLIMRHYNGIISGLQQNPTLLQPIWGSEGDGADVQENAESWAYGFCEGVKLSQAAWKPLLDHPDGQRWFKPIALLGGDDSFAPKDELPHTIAQCCELTKGLVDKLFEIHDFWLPLRHAVYERKQAQVLSTKVGRNESCPCGSAKKFKKCCGAPAELH